ncbi:MAG: hypothetical protein ABIO16_17275 [Nocardioides sp.]
MELTSRSAIRGAVPQQVVDVVRAHLGTADEGVGTEVQVSMDRDGWTVVTWPPYFAPRDLEIARDLSRDLHTVVSAVTTTADEGWSHHLFGCGTVLDQHHSYPAGLAWDDGDVQSLADEWRGDFELVARVTGVEACAVRRHFCQATLVTRDHPGRDRDGYLGLWSALGIRVSGETYAAIPVAATWSAVTAG